MEIRDDKYFPNDEFRIYEEEDEHTNENTMNTLPDAKPSIGEINLKKLN